MSTIADRIVDLTAQRDALNSQITAINSDLSLLTALALDPDVVGAPAIQMYGEPAEQAQ